MPISSLQCRRISVLRRSLCLSRDVSQPSLIFEAEEGINCHEVGGSEAEDMSGVGDEKYACTAGELPRLCHLPID